MTKLYQAIVTNSALICKGFKEELHDVEAETLQMLRFQKGCINHANNTFSEGWLQKSYEFAGLRTAPANHHAKDTANTTFSCRDAAKRR